MWPSPTLMGLNSWHEGIVKLLLARQDTNPNTPDTQRCNTPRLRAVQKAHPGIVKWLSEPKDLGPDIQSPSSKKSPSESSLSGTYRDCEVTLPIQTVHSNPMPVISLRALAKGDRTYFNDLHTLQHRSCFPQLPEPSLRL